MLDLGAFDLGTRRSYHSVIDVTAANSATIEKLYVTFILALGSGRAGGPPRLI